MRPTPSLPAKEREAVYTSASPIYLDTVRTVLTD